MTINDRIFATLKAQGKTQSDLARVLDVRVATVSEWKRGRTTPSAATVGNIAAYLGVSCDYLCAGVECSPAASVQQGVFGVGNDNNAVTINGNGDMSEIEGELLRICRKLDVRRKNALLTRAYELECEVDGGNV